MSLESPQVTTEVDADQLTTDVLRQVLGDALLNLDHHVHAPEVTIRPDDVQAVLSTFRDDLGFDHLSCVTAQEYEDRYESIYHLKSYDDPTREVSVVVPTPRSDPVSESAEPVFRTADWHEREAYDLIGIEYDDHPDLRRILLPETWQGHPLSLDYDQTRPQVVRYDEHANPLHEDGRTDTNTMVLNIGPHHPATHGVLHLQATLDGEKVVDVDPDIGYIHRCEEQMCQKGTYRHQIMPYPDRWDWGGGGLLNEWAYARTAEALADISVPEYAQIIRTMAAELSRILSHMLAVASYALDVTGEFTATFMYAMRDRELVQNILEDLTGQRLMFNYFRLGGVVWDLPEPREEFFEKTREFLDGLPKKLEEYHDLLTANEILQIRAVDTGVLPPEVAKQYGVTGPVARGSGIDYDLRRDDPYGYYDELDWNVVVEDDCDNFSRLLVRMREVEESAKIIDQCVDLLEDWPEDERNLQSNVPRTLKPDEDTEVYRAVEAAKGELGIYIRSDGTDKPARFKIRGPSFSNLQVLPEIANGEYVADLIASIGSLDTIMGEVDR
ncbi:NADH-quinone oxidoreductase subunit D [Haloferax mediterranei ATCC 33500]|uniref:NADH dehydrogenase, subunit D (Ubiquinone) n=1 Tax=Haloferax mediterranei (strain ATCC 33500 / DSM 1411 / JCM 8866 / NBRC 14739 / NCIMB 2177 / R-4) TaxID=523841 RepID=I3R374_HALMT|nr:NADH-quinone oxidoreductase subunit D [Haloferax mediterranei]AFK18684.1 NADH dehydrogenase, subunit D (ubiquinone) [Haloferax mediterranei ATCC 33500]AHZ21946.1 NADH-quinone oxidoreductase subunit C [Haloferax mediterranei ATCC 33500]EMA03455.1 NADH dehydrogenase, subunit D (ubiquinone) [Haloferax mediterranei ATCC 33500]MDX5988781.1 NADH-quinone oxidoreductase subunit D [Haloferax mediterranei ATCC 33500]QCQ75184.1 NADH-quinone oxidoreductase subunit D [Haloferax mediterranei ATCC 33500]